MQVETCDNNSRFVVDEDDNSKIKLERVELNNLNFHPLEVVSRYFKWVKITHICLFWDETFVNLDVWF